jgi:hypothetical protein
MNLVSLKNAFVAAAFLFAVGHTAMAPAHSLSGALGARAQATDLYQITCFAENGGPATDHLSVSARDKPPVRKPLVSVRFKRDLLPPIGRMPPMGTQSLAGRPLFTEATGCTMCSWINPQRVRRLTRLNSTAKAARTFIPVPKMFSFKINNNYGEVGNARARDRGRFSDDSRANGAVNLPPRTR